VERNRPGAAPQREAPLANPPASAYNQVNEVDAASPSSIAMTQNKIPHDLQLWIDARKRHRLSHAQVQMARELGLNPKKLGKIDNHKQEPWKAPLPQFIEHLYRRRFNRDAPLNVRPVEDGARAAAAKKKAKREERASRRQADAQAKPEPEPELSLFEVENAP
jgi:hypothetical protein